MFERYWPDAVHGGEVHSREVQERLEHFVALLHRWNRRINLIGASTVPQVWTRHIAQSASLADIVPLQGRWLDVGTGAGLPGFVLAILGGGHLNMTLVESDTRKCEFLRAARREIGIDVEIVASRIEALPPHRADVVTARAFAPLAGLLDVMHRHEGPGGIGLFPKGAAWEDEVIAARHAWSFEHEFIARQDAQGAVTLKVWNVRAL